MKKIQISLVGEEDLTDAPSRITRLAFLGVCYHDGRVELPTSELDHLSQAELAHFANEFDDLARTFRTQAREKQ